MIYDRLIEVRTSRWSWIVLFAAILPAILPLLKGFFLHTHDGFSHLFRIVELDQALRSGLVYPRWAPEMAMGYGYPVFNFYAPLTYYVTEVFHLTGFGYINSFNLTQAVGFIASGVGMYLLAHELFGRRSSALLAAVSYVYVPYQFVDIYVRGALGEVYTFVFLPLVFLSITKVVGISSLIGYSKGNLNDPEIAGLPIRLRTILSSPALYSFSRTVRTRYFLLGSLSVAGLVLSHNVMALLAMPLVVGYACWRVFRGELRQNRIVVLQQLAAMILFGFGISAFYWLPALQERRFTRVDVLLDAFFGGVTAQLFTPLTLLQGDLLYNYDFHWQSNPFKIGLVQMAVAAGGIFAIRIRQIRQDVLFLTLGLAGLIFMMSGISAFIWTNVPLISFVEFPWRLLAFVGFFTSLLAGAAGALIIDLLKKKNHLLSLTAIMLLGFIIAFTSFAGLLPLYAGIEEEEISRQAAARFDFNQGAIGTNKAGEYLPVWVRENPLEIPRGAPVVAGSEPVAVPDIAIQEWNPYLIRLQTRAERQSEIKLHAFYFPGWKVEMDGKEAASIVSSSLGLLGIRIPPGDHTITFQFEDTFPRQVSNYISIVCFIYVLILWWRTQDKGLGFSLCILAVIATVLSTGVIRPVLAEKPGNLTPVQANFGSKVKLLAWREGARENSGQRDARVTYFWQALGRMDQSYLVSSTLIGSDGKIWGQSTKGPLYGGTPTSKWEPGEIMADSQTIPLKSGAPAGRYDLYLSLVPGDGGNTLRPVSGVSDPSGGITGLKVGTIEIPAESGANTIPTPAYKINAVVNKAISLDGFDLSSGQGAILIQGSYLINIEPGELIKPRVFARALTGLNEDYTFSLLLEDLEGKLLADRAFVPVMDVYPTSLWFPERVVQKDLSLLLPSNLPPGGYRLLIEVYNGFNGRRLKDDSTGRERIILATLKVPMEKKSSSSPQPALATWKEKISLAEATWVTPTKNYGVVSGLVVPITRGENLRLKLRWQADTVVGEDYTVFVHFIDGLGKVVAQIDRPPGNKNYPTGIWDRGDIVEEEYELQVPGNLLPGRYRILVGLYSPSTLERLTVASGKFPVENMALLLSEMEMR